MWTVAQVMDRCPQAATVFTRFHMACVGCPMAPFETLREAVAAYWIDYQGFLRALGVGDVGEVLAGNSKKEERP